MLRLPPIELVISPDINPNLKVGQTWWVRLGKEDFLKEQYISAISKEGKVVSLQVDSCSRWSIALQTNSSDVRFIELIKEAPDGV